MKHAGDLDLKLSDAGPHLNGDGHVETITKHATNAPVDAIIVADTQLLFNGDFKRSGPDLVISNNDHELVLHDYFRGEKRAPLSSPDGAHLTGDVINALTGYTQYAQADGSPSVSHVIGHVTKLSGTATAIRNGVAIILNNGDDVEKGDVVQSGSNSTLGITFIDGSVFGLASNARMVLNEMIYDPNGSDNKSLISLVAGTISFVAGATAKHGDMKVDTPVATMGIRGTAVLVEIDFSVPAPGLPEVPSGKFQVLVEPNGTTGSYILFDKQTLSPVATVDQAGQQINISQGLVSVTNGQLSPDLQKLISDVFALKFTDNSNTKSYQHFTDSIVPQQFNGLQLTFAEFVSQTQNLNSLSLNLTTQQTVTDSFFISVKTVDVIPVINKASFTIQDQVVVFDSNPNDTVTPYVQGSAAIQSVTGPSIVPAGVDLAKLVTVDPASGAIHYDPAQFAFLSANQSVVVTIAFDTTAGSETFHETLSVTITGTNAAPAIITSETTATGAIGEKQAVTGSTASDSVAGSIAFSDTNLSDTHTVGLSAPTFTWSGGALSASQLAALSSASALTLTETDSTGTGTGSVAWHFTAPDQSFDFLAAGETLTIAYAVKLDDGQGGTVTQIVSVTVTGSNDAPTITATSGAFSELDGTSNSSIDHAGGTITFADVDLTDRPSVSAQFTSFTYQDGSHHDVTSSLSAQQLADIAAVEASLTLTPSSTNANNGAVAWSYDVTNSKFNFLGADETLTLTYAATVDDGHGGVVTQPFTVTITGTNDTPTFAVSSGAFTELPEANNSTVDHAGGTITFADVNLTDRPVASTQFASFTYQDSSHHDVTSSLSAQQLADIAAVEASLTLTPSMTNASNGSVAWSYDVTNSKFNFLGADETLTLTYSATVDDGHGGVVTQPFTVTITGSNDAPTIAVSSGAFTELPEANNSTIDHAGGTITFADVDLTDRPVVSTHFTSFTYQDGSHHDVSSSLSAQQLADIAAVEASLTLTASSTNANNGAVDWSYDVINSKFNFLGADETLTLTYAATVDDGHGGVITKPFTVTITGSNAAPTIAVTSGAFTELPAANNSSVDHAGGTITFADVNLTDRPVASTQFASFTYQDSSHHDVTSSLSAQQLADIAAVEASLTLTPSATNASNGSVAWSYDVINSKLNFLGADETLTLTYAATVDDGHGGVVTQPFTVTITGSNDAPTIAVTSGAFTELPATNNSTIDHAGGAITFADINLTDRPVVSTQFTSFTYQDGSHHDVTSSLSAQQLADIAAVEASLTLTPSTTNANNGSVAWSYDVTNSKFNFLGAGETLTLTYAATVDDGHGGVVTQPFTVTITGSNDAPTIAVTSGAFTELPQANNSTIDHAGGTVTFADVDLTDRPVVSTQYASFTYQNSSHHDVTSSLSAQQLADIAAVEASLTLTPSTTNANNGSVAWSYDVTNSKFNFLGADETLTLTYAATVDDGHGGVVTQPFTVTITGSNDAPTIAVSSGAFTELPQANNSTIDHAGGTVTFADVDLTDRPAVSTQFTSFTYQDGSHHDVTSSLSAQQLADIAAVEASLTLTPATTNANNGSVAWSYDVINSKFNFLGADETLTLTYAATVDDGHGGVVTQPFAVTITGSNDAPTIAVTSGAFTELPEANNSTIDHAGGTISFADVDLTDRPVVSTQFNSFSYQNSSHNNITSSLSAQQRADIAAVEASLTLTPSTTNANNGSVAWSYDVTNSKFDFLNAGDTLTLTYTATVNDGHGGLVTEPFTVTVTGTNDIPTIVAGLTTATGAFTHSDQTGHDVATGSIAFADADLSDVHTVSKATPTFVWSGGTLSQSKLSTLASASALALTETDSTGTGSGSVAWKYSLADSGADLLSAGQTLTVTYAVTVNDGHGGSAIQNAVVTVTGMNDDDSDPAGVAGSPINLGLTQLAGVSNEAITVSGSPTNWTMSGATDNANGTWTEQTNDFSALTIMPDVNFVGAAVLHVVETWTNPDGTTGSMTVSDNVEAYAPGSPIFAVAGDDHLTGTGTGNLFVFAQPIANDIIYNFNATSDKIDLVGFNNIAGFADIQGNIADDANGNAVIKIAADETITVYGVHAASITASDFVFNQAPITENPGTMQIGDGAHLAISGEINNSGTIELNSSGDETALQLIEHGITLTGAGNVILSDSLGNELSGTSPDVTLTNVDNTISGAGQIGAGQLTLINEGTIDATGANALTIDTGANVVTNSGTLEATDSGGLVVDSDVINTGLLWANGGNITFEGNVSGDGSALISGASKLEFAAASAENVAFAPGSSGILALDHSFDFSGIVSGMTANNHLDLLDVNFANGTTMNYTAKADGSGGTLSVTDGVHTANIVLEGHFNPVGFELGTDHGAGTLISYHDALLA